MASRKREQHVYVLLDDRGEESGLFVSVHRTLQGAQAVVAKEKWNRRVAGRDAREAEEWSESKFADYRIELVKVL